MSAHIRYITIVGKSEKQDINDMVAEFQPDGGGQTVTVPLLPETADMLEENISHYWFNWNIKEEHRKKWVDLLSAFDLTWQEAIDLLESNFNIRFYPAADWTHQQVLNNEGLKRYQTDVI